LAGRRRFKRIIGYDGITIEYRLQKKDHHLRVYSLATHGFYGYYFIRNKWDIIIANRC